jgi:hypothetical protein
MSGGNREKQRAKVIGGSSAKGVNVRGGSVGNSRKDDSPPKTQGKKGNKRAGVDDDAREEALIDAQQEIEAMEGSCGVTPPPQSSRRNGPAGGTAERGRALELKEAKDKALEAETKAAKLVAELEKMKEQFQKEKRKKEPGKPVVFRHSNRVGRGRSLKLLQRRQ